MLRRDYGVDHTKVVGAGVCEVGCEGSERAQWLGGAGLADEGSMRSASAAKELGGAGSEEKRKGFRTAGLAGEKCVSAP